MKKKAIKKIVKDCDPILYDELEALRKLAAEVGFTKAEKYIKSILDKAICHYVPEEI